MCWVFRACFVMARCCSAGITPGETAEWPGGNVAGARDTSGRVAQSALPRSPRRAPTGQAMRWRGLPGAPPPWRGGVLRHDASPLVGFRCHAGPPHGWGPGWALALAGLGTGRQACHQPGPAPRETDTDGPATPAQREARAPQLCPPQALLGRHAVVQSLSASWATTRLTLMRLCPMAGMAMALVWVRAPSWTRVADDHGCCCPPDFRAVLINSSMESCREHYLYSTTLDAPLDGRGPTLSLAAPVWLSGGMGVGHHPGRGSHLAVAHAPV